MRDRVGRPDATSATMLPTGTCSAVLQLVPASAGGGWAGRVTLGTTRKLACSRRAGGKDPGTTMAAERAEVPSKVGGAMTCSQGRPDRLTGMAEEEATDRAVTSEQPALSTSPSEAGVASATEVGASTSAAESAPHVSAARDPEEHAAGMGVVRSCNQEWVTEWYHELQLYVCLMHLELQAPGRSA